MLRRKVLLDAGGDVSDERDRRDPDHPGHRERRPKSASKDTRRWCKGKVGREHVLAPALPSWIGESTRCHRRGEDDFWMARRTLDADWVCWHFMTCTVCGKIMANMRFDHCPDNPNGGNAS
jgi:hypothetical protein